MKPVFIGSLKIDVPIGLGPMAGVTDSVFRRLCRRQGCGFLYTEMVSAKAVLYGNRGTDALLAFRREEQPLGVQLFGRDPQILAEIEDNLHKFFQWKKIEVLDNIIGAHVLAMQRAIAGQLEAGTILPMSK